MADSIESYIATISSPDLAAKIASAVAPLAKTLFLESVENALANFYGAYSPKRYARTWNFMDHIRNTRTYVFGNDVQMIVPDDSMSGYPGIPANRFHKKQLALDASTAFNYFYEQGMHGNNIPFPDYYNVVTSTPPDQLVNDDVDSGFGGKLDVAIDLALASLL